MRAKTPQSVFCERLRAIREASGLSQKRLGILAGLDPFVSSARINRYEKGLHEPDTTMASRLAAVLGVPLAYLYAEDDRLARVIVAFAALSRRAQDRLLKAIENAAGK